MIDNRIFVEDAKHSKIGASSAHRFLACPGSINLIAKLTKSGVWKNKTNPAAAEGTAAHTLLSSCLEDDSNAEEMRGINICVANFEFEVDDEMIEGVQMTLDFVRNTVKEYEEQGHEVRVYVEKGLESVFDDEVYGTSDVIIHVVGVKLIIIDFKYGKGIVVEPTSIQNKYYSYLAVENYLGPEEQVAEVESWIAQPRIKHAQGFIRKHVTNATDLTKWFTSVLLPGVERTRDPDAPLVIGEHCMFCVKQHCPALKGEALNFVTGIEGTNLTDEELGTLLTKAKAIVKYIKDLEKEAFNRMLKGSEVKDWKLVNKIASRVFKEGAEIEAVETFGDDAFEPSKLKTPPQIEKLEGGAEFVAEWAHKPDTGLTLAPASDRRSAVKSLMDISHAQEQKANEENKNE